MDREKVIEALENADMTDGVIKMSNQFRDIVVELLKEQEVKIGHWNGPECSHCHAILERKCRFFKYCPYCGAKMDNAEGR